MITGNKQLLVLTLLQFISIYLMATGVCPGWVAWVNFGLIILYILAAPVFEGLLLVIASIPFYVVLPQHFSDTLSMWRPVVGILFLKVVWEWIKLDFSRGWPWPPVLGSGRASLAPTLKGCWHKLVNYEKIAIILFVVGVLSLALARYPLRGAAQLVFLLNTVLVYPIIVWTVKSREQVIRLLKYGALSTGLIIFIGYIQFIATLFTVTYYFWQYWALRVANLFYGSSLAHVLQYSNSWVTVSGENKTLRMFSIMPSSHAFAMVCVFFLAFALPLLYLSSLRSSLSSSRRRGPMSASQPTTEDLDSAQLLAGKRAWIPDQVGNDRVVRGNDRNAWLWAAIVLVCLALIFSGTRGVWAGMVPALVIAGFFYHWKRLELRTFVAPIYAAMLIVVILFTASPALDLGLGWVRSVGQSTLDRLVSITNTEETSNAGRIAMWKAAGKYALHHPLGVGYANFVVTLNSGSNNLSFEEAAKQENKLYNLPQRYITAHSLYLQLLVELSAIGLVLFGLFWVFFYYKTWQYLKSRLAEITPEAVYVTSIAILFFWFLAYSVFDLTWLNDKILLYTFLALGIVRVVLSDKTNRTNKSYTTNK